MGKKYLIALVYDIPDSSDTFSLLGEHEQWVHFYIVYRSTTHSLKFLGPAMFGIQN